MKVIKHLCDVCLIYSKNKYATCFIQNRIVPGKFFDLCEEHSKIAKFLGIKTFKLPDTNPVKP